jgi:hypothetical protein
MKSMIKKSTVLIVLCLIVGFVISPALGARTIDPIDPPSPDGPGIHVVPGGLTPIQPLQPLQPVLPAQSSGTSGRADPGTSGSSGLTTSEITGTVTTLNQVPLTPPSTSMLTHQIGAVSVNTMVTGSTSGPGSSSAESGSQQVSGTGQSGLAIAQFDIGNNPLVQPSTQDSHKYQPVTIPGLNGQDIPIGQNAGDLLAQASGKENQARNLEKTVSEMLGTAAPGKGTFTGNQYGGDSLGIDGNNPFQKSQTEDIGRNLLGAHETQSGFGIAGSLGSEISSGNIGLSLQNSPADGASNNNNANSYLAGFGVYVSGAASKIYFGASTGGLSGAANAAKGLVPTIGTGIGALVGVVVGDMILGGGGDSKLVTHEELVKQVQEKEAAQRAATAMPAYDPNNPTDQSIPGPNPDQEDESGAHSGSGWTPGTSNQYSIGNLIAFAQNAGQYQGNDNGEYGLGSDSVIQTGTGLSNALINYHGGYGTSGGYETGQSGHGGDTGGYEYTSIHGPVGYSTYLKWADMSKPIRDAGQPTGLD